MAGKASALLKSGLVAAVMSGTAFAAQDNWSYSGANGPQAWHTLDSANMLCRVGQNQSPINIEGTDPVVMHRLITDYKVTPIDLKHNGHSISMTYQDGSILSVGQRFFKLHEMSFHTPAEHTIAGNTYPMSVQFKHRGPAGDWAIIEVLVREGKANLAATEFLNSLPLEAGQSVKQANVLVNGRDLMPTNKPYFRYMGSLSTPPCSEGVHWYVLKEPIEFSKAQIDLIKGIVGGDSARPLQPRNNRMILDARPQ